MKEEKSSADDPQNAQLLREIDELASKESKRTPVDVYNEVVFDEVNDELMKSVQKASGDTIIMLIRQERLRSFSKLWVAANPDFYQTQENKKLSERLKASKGESVSQDDNAGEQV